MAVMMGNLYAALVKAGAGEDEAKKAAAYELRAADLKTDISSLRGDLKSEIAGVRGELTLVKWMLGFNLAMTVAIILRLFLPLR